MRDFLPAGAQGGAAPEIDHRGARHFAVGLHIRANHLIGREPSQIGRGRRRQHARIGGEHVATGRQDIAAAARRGTSRPRCDSPPVQGGEDRSPFRCGACAPSSIANVGGLAPIDVKPVLYRDLLEVAQPSIDAPQCVIGISIEPHARLDRKPGAFGLFKDQPRKALPPASIKAVRLCIFINKTLEIAGVSRKPALDERRRQVADSQGRDPPLCLRGFSGVADDEWIDDGQTPDHQFGTRPSIRGSTTRSAPPLCQVTTRGCRVRPCG